MGEIKKLMCLWMIFLLMVSSISLAREDPPPNEDTNEKITMTRGTQEGHYIFEFTEGGAKIEVLGVSENEAKGVLDSVNKGNLPKQTIVVREIEITEAKVIVFDEEGGVQFTDRIKDPTYDVKFYPKKEAIFRFIENTLVEARFVAAKDFVSKVNEELSVEYHPDDVIAVDLENSEISGKGITIMLKESILRSKENFKVFIDGRAIENEANAISISQGVNDAMILARGKVEVRHKEIQFFGESDADIELKMNEEISLITIKEGSGKIINGGVEFIFSKGEAIKMPKESLTGELKQRMIIHLENNPENDIIIDPDGNIYLGKDGDENIAMIKFYRDFGEFSFALSRGQIDKAKDFFENLKPSLSEEGKSELEQSIARQEKFMGLVEDYDVVIDALSDAGTQEEILRAESLYNNLIERSTGTPIEKELKKKILVDFITAKKQEILEKGTSEAVYNALKAKAKLLSSEGKYDDAFKIYTDMNDHAGRIQTLEKVLRVKEKAFNEAAAVGASDTQKKLEEYHAIRNALAEAYKQRILYAYEETRLDSQGNPVLLEGKPVVDLKGVLFKVTVDEEDKHLVDAQRTEFEKIKKEYIDASSFSGKVMLKSRLRELLQDTPSQKLGIDIIFFLIDTNANEKEYASILSDVEYVKIKAKASGIDDKEVQIPNEIIKLGELQVADLFGEQGAVYLENTMYSRELKEEILGDYRRQKLTGIVTGLEEYGEYAISSQQDATSHEALWRGVGGAVVDENTAVINVLPRAVVGVIGSGTNIIRDTTGWIGLWRTTSEMGEDIAEEVRLEINNELRSMEKLNALLRTDKENGILYAKYVMGYARPEEKLEGWTEEDFVNLWNANRKSDSQYGYTILRDYAVNDVEVEKAKLYLAQAENIRRGAEYYTAVKNEQGYELSERDALTFASDPSSHRLFKNIFSPLQMATNLNNIKNLGKGLLFENRANEYTTNVINKENQGIGKLLRFMSEENTKINLADLITDAGEINREKLESFETGFFKSRAFSDEDINDIGVALTGQNPKMLELVAGELADTGRGNLATTFMRRSFVAEAGHLERMGDVDGALRMWAESAKIDPSFSEEAIRRVEQIKSDAYLASYGEFATSTVDLAASSVALGGVGGAVGRAIGGTTIFQGVMAKIKEIPMIRAAIETRAISKLPGIADDLANKIKKGRGVTDDVVREVYEARQVARFAGRDLQAARAAVSRLSAIEAEQLAKQSLIQKFAGAINKYYVRPNIRMFTPKETLEESVEEVLGDKVEVVSAVLGGLSGSGGPSARGETNVRQETAREVESLLKEKEILDQKQKTAGVEEKATLAAEITDIARRLEEARRNQLEVEKAEISGGIAELKQMRQNANTGEEKKVVSYLQNDLGIAYAKVEQLLATSEQERLEAVREEAELELENEKTFMTIAKSELAKEQTAVNPWGKTARIEAAKGVVERAKAKEISLLQAMEDVTSQLQVINSPSAKTRRISAELPDINNKIRQKRQRQAKLGRTTTEEMLEEEKEETIEALKEEIRELDKKKKEIVDAGVAVIAREEKIAELKTGLDGEEIAANVLERAASEREIARLEEEVNGLLARFADVKEVDETEGIVEETTKEAVTEQGEVLGIYKGDTKEVLINPAIQREDVLKKKRVMRETIYHEMGHQIFANAESYLRISSDELLNKFIDQNENLQEEIKKFKRENPSYGRISDEEIVEEMLVRHYASIKMTNRYNALIEDRETGANIPLSEIPPTTPLKKYGGVSEAFQEFVLQKFRDSSTNWLELFYARHQLNAMRSEGIEVSLGRLTEEMVAEIEAPIYPPRVAAMINDLRAKGLWGKELLENYQKRIVETIETASPAENQEARIEPKYAPIYVEKVYEEYLEREWQNTEILKNRKGPTTKLAEFNEVHKEERIPIKEARQMLRDTLITLYKPFYLPDGSKGNTIDYLNMYYKDEGITFEISMAPIARKDLTLIIERLVRSHDTYSETINQITKDVEAILDKRETIDSVNDRYAEESRQNRVGILRNVMEMVNTIDTGAPSLKMTNKKGEIFFAPIIAATDELVPDLKIHSGVASLLRHEGKVTGKFAIINIQKDMGYAMFLHTLHHEINHVVEAFVRREDPLYQQIGEKEEEERKALARRDEIYQIIDEEERAGLDLEDEGIISEEERIERLTKIRESHAEELDHVMEKIIEEVKIAEQQNPFLVEGTAERAGYEFIKTQARYIGKEVPNLMAAEERIHIKFLTSENPYSVGYLVTEGLLQEGSTTFNGLVYKGESPQAVSEVIDGMEQAVRENKARYLRALRDPLAPLSFTTKFNIAPATIKDPKYKTVTVHDELPDGTFKDITSTLYSRLDEENIYDTFTYDLPASSLLGTKAVVYLNDKGEYEVVFASESINTHHKHILDAITTEGKDVTVPYESLLQNSGKLLPKSFGFDLQFDPETEKIVGVQMNSQITEQQLRDKTKIQEEILEDAEQALLEHIDPSVIDSELVARIKEEGIDAKESFRKLIAPKKQSALQEIIIEHPLVEEMLEEYEREFVLGEMIGTDPSNPTITSQTILYTQINKATVDDVFTQELPYVKDLEGDPGNVLGTKAVVYLNENGEWMVVFPSESRITHHAQIFAALIGERIGSDIYKGVFKGTNKGYLYRVFGFQLDLDKETEKIIRIEMDSRITNAQADARIELKESVVIEAEEALLRQINERLIDERLLEQITTTGKISQRPDGLNIFEGI